MLFFTDYALLPVPEVERRLVVPPLVDVPQLVELPPLVVEPVRYLIQG